MTDLITAEEAEALLDGATPGPWRADGEPWNRIVWSSADNRVCFMAHSSGLNDARDTATSNLVAAAPDLARALLDARADAAAAQALVVERAAEQADPWDGPVTKNKIVDAQAIAAQQIKARIRDLAPIDGLALVRELRAELDGSRKANREMVLQVLAALGQAQEAYEAQSKAEAERDRLAAANAALEAKVAGLVEALEDIASAQRFPSHGDPVVLRDRARAALATQEAGTC